MNKMQNGNLILSVLSKYLGVKYQPKSIKYLTDSIVVTFNDCNELTQEDLVFIHQVLHIKVFFLDGDQVAFDYGGF